MTKKEKDLLFQDLSCRLPYGVILLCCDMVGEKLTQLDESGLVNNDYDIDEVKPYLFPLSSMTEEQEEEYFDLRHWIQDKLKDWKCADLLDWLNSHHFDYRGLIEKSLALDATNLGIYE